MGVNGYTQKPLAPYIAVRGPDECSVVATRAHVRMCPSGHPSSVLQKLFRFARSGCALHLPGLIGARIPLTDSSRLATQFAQVIELGAPDAPLFHHIDMIDDGGVQRKDPFDADTETGFANGNRLARAAVLAGDDDAL